MHDFNIRLKWTKSIIRPILNQTNKVIIIKIGNKEVRIRSATEKSIIFFIKKNEISHE